ncbi:hypothetical protein MKW98_001385, partial [Papaver atlanticum]
ELVAPSQKQKRVAVHKKCVSKEQHTPTRPVTRAHPAKKKDDIYESGSKFSASYKNLRRRKLEQQKQYH